MKKISLLLSALAVGLTAAAQSQPCFMDVQALGFTGDVIDAAGTVLCEDANGKLTLAFNDDMNLSAVALATYNFVSVAGSEPTKIPTGCKGRTDGTSPLAAAPGTAQMIKSGCVYKLETTKTGYFFFLTALNTNRSYYVMEGDYNLYAYALGVALDPSNNEAGLNRLYYTLPDDAFGNVNMHNTHASDFLDGEAPYFTKIKTPGATMGVGNVGVGSGFLCIASYASERYPSTFYYWAEGERMSNNGFIYVPAEEPLLDDIPSIVFSGVEKINEETGETIPAPTPVVFGDTNAVGSISAASDENAPVYNLFGQKVGKDAKGILIQNGKKFIRK